MSAMPSRFREVWLLHNTVLVAHAPQVSPLWHGTLLSSLVLRFVVRDDLLVSAAMLPSQPNVAVG